MSDDRSPMDGWFRDEPGIPPATSAPYRSQGGNDDVSGGDYAGADAPTQQISQVRPVSRPNPILPADEFDSRPPRQRQPMPDETTQVSQFPQMAEFPQASQAPRPPQSRVNSYPEPEFRPRQRDPRDSYDQRDPRESRESVRSGSGSGGTNRMPLIAGGAVAGVAVLGLIAYLALGNSSPKTGNTASGGTGGVVASPSPTHTSFQPTSADPATAAEQTGAAFLTAWQNGDLQTAAKYTDNPTAALAALNDYKSGLSLSALTLKPQPAVVAGASPSASAGAAAGAPSGASASTSASAGTGTAASPSGTVPFTASATVSLPAQSATGQSLTTGQATATASADNTPISWNYSSSLVAYKQSDGWSVRWNPSILAPNLTDGEKLSVVPVAPGVGKITDNSGTRLSSYSEGALQNVAASLSKKAPSGNGTPGVAVQIVDASGKAVGDVSATLRKAVDIPSLKTTIDPTMESLARAAVSKNPRSSMVILRPSTGAILAVANSAGSGDTALAGGLAPGSTFKIVTSTALLNYGFVTLDTPVACPLTVTVQGVVYHNSTDASGKNEESLPPGTPFITDFAQSCNNAFTPFYKQLDGGKLASTAAKYFGLNQSWDIGLGSNSYFSIPTDSSGAELAQENFGQGQVVASPLAMTSVAATVGTGSFQQPYLVDGVTKATATPLPSGTDANLKTMMHAVVTEGTAAGVFSGVAGPVYAKTGTAETDANKDGKPNAWIVVYDPRLDVAVGAVVQDSGFGATFAGPEAAYVLSRL